MMPKCSVCSGLSFYQHSIWMSQGKCTALVSSWEQDAFMWNTRRMPNAKPSSAFPGAIITGLAYIALQLQANVSWTHSHTPQMLWLLHIEGSTFKKLPSALRDKIGNPTWSELTTIVSLPSFHQWLFRLREGLPRSCGMAFLCWGGTAFFIRKKSFIRKKIEKNRTLAFIHLWHITLSRILIKTYYPKRTWSYITI